MSLSELARMKQEKRRIAMVTAYDAPSARLADDAGVDCILVGDSAAMTVLGHESTLPITMDEMVMLTGAVTRGARRPLIIADMPFGSYQVTSRRAVQSAVRLVKEGGADAVKLEGAGLTLKRVSAIVGAGVPVVGHVGLTPQSATLLGGYKTQGQTATKARRLIDEARALQDAGCFAVVLEAMPEPVGARITEALSIPTIGIGAGASCDGQVLVWHDLLGLTTGHVPLFVQRYAAIGEAIRTALGEYVRDVRSGAFPSARHRYAMPAAELDVLNAG
ncbi:MAG: 3-methyl-2-oxobutanoate hydroxymethyltransferase [Vicinamibacterales bacterium]